MQVKINKYYCINFDELITSKFLILPMSFTDTLITRRSIRCYTGEKVSDEQIETILKAGMYAPSAENKQPWHFVLFRDREVREKIIAVHKNAWMLSDADLGILVCYDEELQHDEGYGPLDCAAATQNMLLAAHGLGLGAVWLGIFPREKRVSALHDLFKLPDNVKPFSVIALGHPDEEKPFPERYKKERVHWESW